MREAVGFTEMHRFRGGAAAAFTVRGRSSRRCEDRASSVRSFRRRSFIGSRAFPAVKASAFRQTSLRHAIPCITFRTAPPRAIRRSDFGTGERKKRSERLIYAICCDRIVIPIYGAFSSRSTSDIPGVHRIGGSGTARRDRPHFCLLAPTGTGFSKPKLSKSGFVRSRLSPEAEAPAHRKTAVYHFHCRRGRRKGRIKWHHTEIFIHIPNSATDAIRWKKWRRRRSIRECTR